MSPKTFFAFLAPLTLVACLAKTTSLGSTNDKVEASSTDADAGAAVLPDGSSSVVGGAAPDGGDGSNEACLIAPEGLPVAPCPAGEYCVSDNATCSGSSHCKTMPGASPPDCPSLECACDGVIRCRGVSRANGTDLAPAGYCAVPCGATSCDGLTQLCMRMSGGIAPPDGGVSTNYQCLPIPTTCATEHTCACVTATLGGSAVICTDKDGKIELEGQAP
jgi:hypothetical protein